MTEAASAYLWSNKREARLRVLWDRGLTGGQIAAAMGTSRAAILGKVRRMKLSSRVPKKTRGWSQAAKDRNMRSRIIRKVFGEQPQIPKAAKPINASAWDALPGSTPVPLAELTGCKWPIGQEAPYLFCGEAHAPGRSYCPQHQELSTGNVRGKTDVTLDLTSADVNNASSSDGHVRQNKSPAAADEAQEPSKAPAHANTSVRIAA
jgi:hypothetical protein